MKRLLTITLLMFIASQAFGNAVILELENDILAGTDRRYTHGTRITYEYNDLYWSIGQNIYTPEDIEATIPSRYDRPYAGVLYLSLSGTKFWIDGKTTTGYRKSFHQLTVSIGTVGKYSFAEETQTFIHGLMDGRDPNGWDYQVEDAFLLQGNWKIHGDIFRNRHLSTTVYMDGEVGTISSHTGVGGTILTGYNIPRALNHPIISEVNDLSVYVHIDLLVKNVFDNDLLKSDHTQITKTEVVLESRLSAGVIYKNYEFRYTFVYRSEEFEEQEEPTMFGGFFFKYDI